MTVIFAVVIALAAVSALGVVFSRQTIYSALSLVVTVALLAVLFLLLNAQFLFAVAADHLRRRRDGPLRLHRRTAEPRRRGPAAARRCAR